MSIAGLAVSDFDCCEAMAGGLFTVSIVCEPDASVSSTAYVGIASMCECTVYEVSGHEHAGDINNADAYTVYSCVKTEDVGGV